MSDFRYTPTSPLIYADALMLFVERVRPISSLVFLDDEESDLRACSLALQPRTVHTTTRVADLFELVERARPELALIDFFLGEQRGYAPDGSSRRKNSLAVSVVRELRDRQPQLLILVVSNGSCDPFRGAVKAAGADEMIHKLVGWKKIIDIVEAGMLRDPDGGGGSRHSRSERTRRSLRRTSTTSSMLPRLRASSISSEPRSIAS
jgi:DNA-binding NarL/FixJ family response regulator